MKKILLVSLNTLPVVLMLFLNTFLWQHNVLLLTIYLALSGVFILAGEDPEIETRIFVYGLAAGFVIEHFGTRYGGYQQFSNPDFGSIPSWLLIAWGYAFVAMKRISLVIATSSPWIKK